MSHIHILFPTPVYQTVLDFRPSELKHMLDFLKTCGWAPDMDIVNRPNGETTKLQADLLSSPELRLLEIVLRMKFISLLSPYNLI